MTIPFDAASRRSGRGAASALALSLALAAAGGCESTADVRNLHVVEEGVLLRSGQPTPMGLADLRDRFGVQTVINLNDRTTDDELIPAMALGLDYVPLPMRVSNIDRDKLVDVLAAVRQAEAEGRVPVLVHCQSGQDRTGAAVAAYRVVEQGWDGEDAEAEMERHRHWTHEVLFPQVRRIAPDASAFRDVWEEAVERTGRVNVIRPPVPWTSADAANGRSKPSGLEGVRITTHPGVR